MCYVICDNWVKSGHVTFEWQIQAGQAITKILSLVFWTESGKQHLNKLVFMDSGMCISFINHSSSCWETYSG